jgi:hypothetical protein
MMRVVIFNKKDSYMSITFLMQLSEEKASMLSDRDENEYLFRLLYTLDACRLKAWLLPNHHINVAQYYS